MSRNVTVEVVCEADGTKFSGTTMIGEFSSDVTGVKATAYQSDGKQPKELAVHYRKGPSEGVTVLTVSGVGPAGTATVNVGVGQPPDGDEWDAKPAAITGANPEAAAIPPQGKPEPEVEADPKADEPGDEKAAAPSE